MGRNEEERERGERGVGKETMGVKSSAERARRREGTRAGRAGGGS
jgi:hypothetical protein